MTATTISGGGATFNPVHGCDPWRHLPQLSMVLLRRFEVPLLGPIRQLQTDDAPGQQT